MIIFFPLHVTPLLQSSQERSKGENEKHRNEISQIFVTVIEFDFSFVFFRSPKNKTEKSDFFVFIFFRPRYVFLVIFKSKTQVFFPLSKQKCSISEIPFCRAQIPQPPYHEEVLKILNICFVAC